MENFKADDILERLQLAESNKYFEMAKSFFIKDEFLVNREKILTHKFIEEFTKSGEQLQQDRKEKEEGKELPRVRYICPKVSDWSFLELDKYLEDTSNFKLNNVESRTSFWVGKSQLPIEICESIARYELNKLPSKQQVKESLKLYKKKERRKEREYKDNPALERMDNSTFIKSLNKCKNNIVFF
jgi:hypothetical protein